MNIKLFIKLLYSKKVVEYYIIDDDSFAESKNLIFKEEYHESMKLQFVIAH